GLCGVLGLDDLANDERFATIAGRVAAREEISARLENTSKTKPARWWQMKLGRAGVLWMTIMFAGNLALGRTFERERQSETLCALMLVPAPRPAVYLGKLVGTVVFLALNAARAW